jgi:NAD(P)-dependent dehydrogenase (short-subunit alcohol dehydrogenase family)
MPTVLITGANRGIGLELARQYAADGWEVIATARKPSEELEELGIKAELLDMREMDAVAGFGTRLDQAIDLLIANAGTYGPRTMRSAKDAQEWSATFAINSIAPLLLAQSVTPHVSATGGKLIAITSKMGSIADNSSGGYTAYRSSKAALNMAWRSLAIDNPSVVAAVLHPGWVKTRMGGSHAPLTVVTSATGLRQTIERLGPDQSGGFFNYDGTPLPW